MPFLPGSQPPGARVVVTEGPEGKKGDPGPPGDPTSLLSVLTPGDALTRDAQGNPASLGPVASANQKAFAPGLAQVQHLTTYGHSLLAGGAMASPATNRPTAVLARMLSGVADDQMFAVGGSGFLTAEPSPGGWGWLFAQVDKSNAALPQLGLVVLWTGVNDLGGKGAAVVNTPGASGDLCREALISYLRARPGSFRGRGSSVFSYDGSWVDGDNNAGTGGIGVKVSVAANSVITETFSMAEAGTHVVCFAEYSPFGGSKWEVREGGTLLATVDNSAVNSGGWHPAVVRIPNLAVGSHTLTIKNTALGASFPYSAFYGSWDEGPTVPVVLDVLQYKPSSYGVYGGSAFPVDDAAIDAMNGRIRAIASTFDGYVVPVDMGALLDRKRGLMGADQFHLNVAGSQVAGLALHRAATRVAPTAPTPIAA